MSKTTELKVFHEVNPILVLSDDNLPGFLAKIEKEVHSVVFDPETEEGRQGMVDMGKKIQASIRFIKTPALEHARKLKAAPDIFDAQRKKYKDFMEALKEDVLKPALEYVAAETAKTEAIESLIESLKIADAKNVLIPEAAEFDTLNTWISEAKERLMSADFGDQLDRARGVLDDSLLKADGLVARFEKDERAETAAAIKLEAEKQEAQEKRDEELLKEATAATAKAKQDAKDATLKAEQDAIVAKKLAEERAKVSKEREEQAVKDAKARAVIVAAAARQSAEQAIQDAVIKAEDDLLQAVQDERDRAAKAEADAKDKLDKENAVVAKKQANKKHRHTIHTSCVQRAVELGFDKDTASKFIKVISEDKFDHLKVVY